MKLAIFDMDGTLIDSLKIWDVFWIEFGKRFLQGKEFNPSKEDRDFVKTCMLKEGMERIHNHYKIGKDANELVEVIREIAREFYGNTVELKVGVKEFLECCSEKGITMCVLSATEPALVDIALNHCDIKKYFSEVFSCVTLGKGKEEPELFLDVCKYFGVNVSDAWMFEDAALALETARAVGLKTVGVYEQYRENQDVVKAASTVYVSENETMMKLVDYI